MGDFGRPHLEWAGLELLWLNRTTYRMQHPRFFVKTNGL
jgi:hypothetical protein